MEVIEGVLELAQLNERISSDKTKAKTQAKNNDLRRRKALADLFKCLKLIGASP